MSLNHLYLLLLSWLQELFVTDKQEQTYGTDSFFINGFLLILTWNFPSLIVKQFNSMYALLIAKLKLSLSSSVVGTVSFQCFTRCDAGSTVGIVGIRECSNTFIRNIREELIFAMLNFIKYNPIFEYVAYLYSDLQLTNLHSLLLLS